MKDENKTYWVCTECKVVIEKSRTKDIGTLRRHIGKSFSLTDTGEDSKLVHRRKRPKVDTLFPSPFSDASERRV